ncbi:MAG: CDGSH iron-sulfur domain-containing protein [Actinomycetota bacterium]|nr:CDGSH iron-sulfur domain-containing protein [Actinomycetota bacterium]
MVGRSASEEPPAGRGAGATGKIEVRENGPYRLIDADGNEYDLGGRGEVVALSPCGGSTTKPLCAGTHSAGFEAAERAVAAEERS